MLQIKVEATSANVCVGFDVLGISLKLYNTITFKKSDDFSFVGFLDEYSQIPVNALHIVIVFGRDGSPMQDGVDLTLDDGNRCSDFM